MLPKGFPLGRLIFFVTMNVHKFNEARRVLAEYSIATAMLKIKASENQDDNIENIAKASALDAAKRSHLPVIVEDAGLFIDALNGFPGPYSNYVYRTIGKESMLKLLQNYEDRTARFRSVVVFCYHGEILKCFQGIVEGKIAEEIRGRSGFGFDPIFEPSDVLEQTFGEMSDEEKNKISHRARAIREFAKWYKQSVDL